MQTFVKTNNQDVQLFYIIDKATNAKANVLINHGFAEHTGRYDHIARYLVEAGYNVLRYDLRGHGQSIGPKGHIDNYRDFISDANLMVDLIKNQFPDLKTFMLGHSMGGLISTLYGLQYPNKLAGQIISGAANGKLPVTSGVKANVLAFAAKLIPMRHLKNPVSKDICSVPEVVTAYENDPLVLKSATLCFYDQFSNKATNEILAKMSQYKLPVLILHGEKDKIVNKSVSENFYDKIASVDKEIVIYPDLFHEIFNELENSAIFEKIVQWLNSHIKEVWCID